MSDDFTPSRLVTLANGSTVPLGRAAAQLGILRSYLDLQDTEWDAVYYLREVCLGRSIEPEQAQTLARARLLHPDGTVDPVLRAVVLSAVRGQGRVLHLDSPFTDPLDQALANYAHACNTIESYLDPEQARSFFANSPLQLGDAIRDAAPPIPPGFTDEILRRMRQSNPPDGETPGWSDRVNPPDHPDDLPPRR